MSLDVVAEGLRFPEGPVAMDDGSVLVVEMFGARITRILPDGTLQTVAEMPGGPNGAAIGPDGALYVCNNGGCFTPVEIGNLLLPGGFDPTRYLGGSIQRVDLATGRVTDLYTHCDGRALRAPNDLVFDGHGGFWFTDHGIRDHHGRTSDLTAIYYALADGSSITEQIFPVEAPNGIGLSPDGSELYWAETFTGRVMRRRLDGPGRVAPGAPLDPSACLAGLPGYQLLDSLAVDGIGNVCVATLVNGGITVVSPADGAMTHVPTDDPLTTNLCFADLDGSGTFRDVVVTCSSGGTVRRGRWPNEGLAPAHRR